ncbi:MAG TPA: response regulator [Herpetosiphonaceae bacterium]
MSAPNEQPHDAVDVLLIEDEAVQSPLRRLLQQGGYRVRAATDGIKGLLQTRSVLPRLMIVDVNLPGLSGFQVLSMIRQTPVLRQVPVVMLTRPNHDGDQQRALELGANASIPRGDAEGQLFPTIQGLFERQPAPQLA